MSIEEKVKALNYVPEVSAKIQAALEAAGIVENEKLDVILPALSGVLQISKSGDGKYNVALINSIGALLTNDAGTPLTIEDWISDYAFEPELPPGAEGSISYEESQNLSEKDLQAIASGKKIILPPKKEKAPNGSIPSSDGRKLSASLEDIASGKTKVDMGR